MICAAYSALKVLSELAMCVNVPKIALMIHPGSTLTNVQRWCPDATIRERASPRQVVHMS